MCQLIKEKWVRVEQEAEDCSWRIALVVLSFSFSLNLKIKRKNYKMQLNMIFLFIAYLFLILSLHDLNIPGISDGMMANF